MQLDPYFRKIDQSKVSTLFAASQLQGDRKIQEDYFLNYHDECVVIADGVGGMPHGDTAAKLACETAVWGYKQIQLRNTYWKDKKLLLKRIFRSTNIAIYQKQKEIGYSDGMATTLSMVMVGQRSIWVGSVGDSPVYILHNGALKKVTHDDISTDGHLTKAIGTMRYGLTPQIYVLHVFDCEAIFMATDGVTNFVSEKDISTIIASSGKTSESMTESVIALLHSAEKGGSKDNMTACLFKWIRN